MDGLAADDAAERNHRVERSPCPLRRLDGDGGRRRNLQRARHGDDLVRDAGLLQFLDGRGQQRVLDIVIEARFDDQGVRARDIGLVLQRCAAWFDHLVRHLWIAGNFR